MWREKAKGGGGLKKGVSGLESLSKRLVGLI